MTLNTLNHETPLSRETLLARETLLSHAEAAIRLIPPAWPLAATVAVNPFLGQTGDDLATVGARLGRIAGVKTTMPRNWYRERIATGAISDADLEAALAASPHFVKPADLAALKAKIATEAPAPSALPSIADLAAEISGLDWPALIADRIGFWAAGYFDEGQALWAAPRGKRPFTAWRAFATQDLTPELHGLTGFAARAQDWPDDPLAVIAEAQSALDLPAEALTSYFHQMLHGLLGWSQTARYRLWQAELAGETDAATLDMLAIRLAFEITLFAQYEGPIRALWTPIIAEHAKPVAASESLIIDAILQEAAERAGQRNLAHILAAPAPATAETRPAVQAAFCIDVRSEVFRRALEEADPTIRTKGFAGFFGVFAQHRRFGSDVGEKRLPVLLNPTVFTCTLQADSDTERKARYAARARRAWGRFKRAAVSSFAFVEATGPVYLGKLLKDGLGLTKTPVPNDPPPRFGAGLDAETKVKSAEMVLRAMALTENFGRIVLLAGHGANVVNNPYASALHCGACGGFSGEVNARLLAHLLNDAEARQGLKARGIEVPEDTLFLGALHDTTTDAVTLYDTDTPSPAHAAEIATLKASLARAAIIARAERAPKLPGARSDADIIARARNWAELRPEWGLAGCQAFLAAPRNRTAGKALEGRAFLHDYDWQADAKNGYPVLELILTAPVVVASWISLQYYGSTVAPEVYGGGNKLLHNVVGGIGVLEGNGGPMRTGLPRQSVHDGESFRHEPLRLTVGVEAPVEAITAILAKHEGVRALFDQRWLHLIALGSDGQFDRRYIGNLAWEAEGPGAAKGTAKLAA
ncbi:MAG: DUF2309 domain-containing protein [Hyphomicrobiales bacterium]|nr:DUF2309 domain-containing protein [Hyphomicrobiales bacterium]